MCFKKILILIVCSFIYGCGDYPSGHKDGYEGIEKNQWIVFGRSEYLDGFYEGEAENYVETNGLQCTEVIFLVDPFMYLPAEYKRIGPDTYKIDF